MNDPIDPQLLGALRRDRERTAPEEARARVALRFGIGSPVPTPERGGGSTAAVATRAAASPGFMAVAFLGGAAVGALLHASFATTPSARVVYIDRPGPTAPSAVLSASAPPPVATAPESVGERALPPASVGARAAAPTAHDGFAQLDAERALLDTARAALVGGDSDAALGALDRHTRTFRHPLLGEERDALLIQALVRAGRSNEARARAEAFRRAAPQSLLLPAVDAAIASIR